MLAIVAVSGPLFCFRNGEGPRQIVNLVAGKTRVMFLTPVATSSLAMITAVGLFRGGDADYPPSAGPVI
jgi:hypothetical protein